MGIESPSFLPSVVGSEGLSFLLVHGIGILLPLLHSSTQNCSRGCGRVDLNTDCCAQFELIFAVSASKEEKKKALLTHYQSNHCLPDLASVYENKYLSST